jgi:hypothetical protein
VFAAVVNSKALALIDYFFSTELRIIANFNKRKTQVNSCMGICLIIVKGKFIVILIPYFILKKSPSEIRNITYLSHISSSLFSYR